MKAVLFGMLVCVTLIAQPTAKPESLLTLISREQVAVTGYSIGVEEYDCYTDVHRAQFESEKGWIRIVDRLKADTRFSALVAQIAAMDRPAREALLRKARASRRPTYAEANPPGPHRDGHSTTDAGAHVESLIAHSIVEAVRSMIEIAAVK